MDKAELIGIMKPQYTALLELIKEIDNKGLADGKTAISELKSILDHMEKF